MASDIQGLAEWEVVCICEDLRTLKTQALVFITIKAGACVISQGLSIVEVEENETTDAR